MKILFLTVVLVAVVGGGFAEADEFPNLGTGHILIGGNVSASTTSYSDTSSISTVSVTPSAAYFILDKFAIGAELTFQSTNSKSAVAAQTSDTFYGAGPIVTYYFWSQGRLATFVSAGAFIGGDNNANTGLAGTVVRAWGGLGLDIFIVPTVAVGPFLFYSHQFQNTVFPSYDSFSLSAGLYVFL